MDNNSNIIKEIFKSVKYMIDASLNKAPFDRTVTGVIVGGSSKKNYYQVMILGKNYELPSFINNNLKPNTTVNIMIPQNNMALAFIYAIFGGELNIPPEGGVVHADRADYAINAGYASTVAVATTEIVGGLRSSSGKNHVYVDETGIATVTSVDNADNALNAQNAVKAQSAVNADNATNATYAVRAGTATNVENVSIATEVKIGGIISSTGPGHVQVDENGVATVPDAGGIKEVPIATDTVVGGLTSSNLSGTVKVDGTTGKSSVNDVVTMKDTGEVKVPENFGNGPWKIICTEDNTPDPVNSGMPTGGYQYQMLHKVDSTDFNTEWIDSYSNPNILDNPYFPNPINQRGIRSDVLWAPQNAPGIDRWRCFGPNTTKWVEGQGIVLIVGINSIIEQYFESARLINGQVYTLSALISLNSSQIPLLIQINIIAGTSKEVNLTIDGNIINLSYLHFPYEKQNQGLVRVWNKTESSTVTVYSMKLEKGSLSTLCRYDKNGNPQLRDSIPNYQQELAKCQRYYLGPITCREAIILSNNFGYLTIHTPVQMNAPTIINPATTTICEYNKITNNIKVSIGSTSVGVNGIYTKFIFENFSASSIIGVAEMYGFTISADL